MVPFFQGPLQWYVLETCLSSLDYSFTPLILITVFVQKNKIQGHMQNYLPS